MTHGQHAGEAGLPSAPTVRRTIVVILLPLILATIVGMVLLWPEETDRGSKRPSEPTRPSSTSRIVRRPLTPSPVRRAWKRPCGSTRGRTRASTS